MVDAKQKLETERAAHAETNTKLSAREYEVRRLTGIVGEFEQKEAARKAPCKLNVGTRLAIEINPALIVHAPSTRVFILTTISEMAVESRGSEGERETVLSAKGRFEWWDSLNLAVISPSGESWELDGLHKHLKQAVEPNPKNRRVAKAIREYLEKHEIVLSPQILNVTSAELFSSVAVASEEHQTAPEEALV